LIKLQVEYLIKNILYYNKISNHLFHIDLLQLNTSTLPDMFIAKKSINNSTINKKLFPAQALMPVQDLNPANFTICLQLSKRTTLPISNQNLEMR